MLKHILIDNFRGFRRLETSLSPVSVLLGPNSSGKTTVLHAIRLVCQSLELALSSETPARPSGNEIVVTKDTLIESPAHLLPLADWQALFVDQEVSEGTSCLIRLMFDESDPIQSLEFVMSYARNKQLKFTLKAVAEGAIQSISGLPAKSSKVGVLLSEWLQRHAPRAVFIPPFYGVVRDEEYRMKVVVDRLVGSGDQSHVVRNLITGLEPRQLDQLNAFLQELTGATISYRTSGDRVETESPLRAEFRDTNGAIEISAAGAGLVNLIALYASLARWQSNAKDGLVLFLLDEPEAHLHPRLQGETARRIASLVTEEFGAQLLMATHSVEIINRLGERPHVTLLRTDRTAQQAVTMLDSQQDVLNDLADWVDLTPFAAINFLASRRVLFHEGTSDNKVLKRCAELRFRQQRDKLRTFERWTFVSLDGSGNTKIVGLLNRLLASPLLWAKNEGAQPFKVATVLDKDYSRTSGFMVSVDETHQIKANVVWKNHSIESVFLDAVVLAYWIRAFAGESTPSDLAAVIALALQQADEDDDLNTQAIDQLMLGLLREPLSDEKGRALAPNTDSHRLRAMTLARDVFYKRGGPAVHQRGKDRATKVLGVIRDHIAPPRKNSFPTDLIKLIERVDLNKISDPVAAIPSEVLELLEWMATAD